MPKQYVVMRPSGVNKYRIVRNVWWSGSTVDLWKALHRVDGSVLVISVETANELFPNVGSWQRERKAY